MGCATNQQDSSTIARILHLRQPPSFSDSIAIWGVYGNVLTDEIVGSISKLLIKQTADPSPIAVILRHIDLNPSDSFCASDLVGHTVGCVLFANECDTFYLNQCGDEFLEAPIILLKEVIGSKDNQFHAPPLLKNSKTGHSG